MNFLLLLEKYNTYYQKHRASYEDMDRLSWVISDSYQKNGNTHKVVEVLEKLYETYGGKCYQFNEHYKNTLTSSDVVMFKRLQEKETEWVPFAFYALKEDAKLDALLPKLLTNQRDKSNVYLHMMRHGKPDTWSDVQWGKFLLFGVLNFSDAPITRALSVTWEDLTTWVSEEKLQPNIMKNIFKAFDIVFHQTPPYKWLIEKMHFFNLEYFKSEDVDIWYPSLQEKGKENILIGNLAMLTNALSYAKESKKSIMKKIHAFYKDGDQRLIQGFINLTEKQQQELIKAIKPTLLIRSALNARVNDGYYVDNRQKMQDTLIQYFNINMEDWVTCYSSGLIEKHPNMSPQDAILKFFGSKLTTLSGPEVEVFF